MSTRESRRKLPCSKCGDKRPMTFRSTFSRNWHAEYHIQCALCRKNPTYFRYEIQAIRAWNAEHGVKP